MFSLGRIDQQRRRIDNFMDIMRRNTGRHADRNAAGTIGQQIGKQARHAFRLFTLAIIGRFEIDRAFVETVHQLDRRAGQPRLGITIGRGIIAVDIAKIPLPVDQRIAQRESLGEPDHRVIDRLISVRVIFTHHVTDHPGAFLIALRRLQLEQPHRPQQAAVHRLQTIAQIRQRPRGDRRHRIDQIAFGQRRIKRCLDDRIKFIFGSRFGRIGYITHGGSDSRVDSGLVGGKCLYGKRTLFPGAGRGPSPDL